MKPLSEQIPPGCNKTIVHMPGHTTGRWREQAKKLESNNEKMRVALQDIVDRCPDCQGLGYASWYSRRACQRCITIRNVLKETRDEAAE